jgi:transposase
MAYREVTMIEIKEVLRLWLAGVPKKRIAATLCVDPKTVRRYIAQGEACGLRFDDGIAALTDERVSQVVALLHTPPAREHGDSWSACEQQRESIEKLLARNVRLSKIRRLLLRQGVDIPYSSLHRYACEQLGFARKAPTVPIVDGEPGMELQVDTGWMTKLDGDGRVRRFRAFVFTPSVSRYRFVYPCLRETTQDAIAAFEAAWDFYGGVFRVVIVDNTKAIVDQADPLAPRLIGTFLEYAQARGFQIDTTRVRKPTDKARVERSIRDVRDDCFAGERLTTIDEACERARRWCELEYGMRRHSTTTRMPSEHFLAVEAEHLLPAPIEPYDVPHWCEPKVARDHFAQVAGALYSLPTRLIGRRLRARADSKLVRFYDDGQLVKTHPRLPKGQRATDPNDFPVSKRGYAMRDVDFLRHQARSHGESIGLYAERLLDSPLPWTRMRLVYALLGLVARFGAEVVELNCRIALEADLLNLKRLRRMIEQAVQPEQPALPTNVIPISRYLRPAKQYALPGLELSPHTNPEQDND